ncbi:hypothetical protein BYT27DRAFT_7181500 [Phlegmacium glaucopus]|nr:hypothetical protein BYT27DRAFT_7181500 [Phlegmacium glaucopus]
MARTSGQQPVLDTARTLKPSVYSSSTHKKWIEPQASKAQKNHTSQGKKPLTKLEA